MDERPIIQFNKIFRSIVTCGVIALIIFLLWYFSAITMYCVLGLIIALMGRPVFNLLARVRFGKYPMPNALNAIVSILTVWAIIGGILALLVPLLINEGKKFSQIDPEKVLKELETPINNSIDILEDYGLIQFPDTAGSDSIAPIKNVLVVTVEPDTLDSNGVLVPASVDTVPEAFVPRITGDTTVTTGIRHREEIEAMLAVSLKRIFSLGEMTNVFGSVFSTVANVLAAIGASLFIAFFFLKDRRFFLHEILEMVPLNYKEKVRAVLQDSRKMLTRYFIGIGIELLLVMICTAIGLLIIGFEFRTAVTIGFFCGFFNIIPYIGPLIGGAFGIFLGITNHIDMDFQTHLLPLVIKMVIVFAVVQALDNNLFQTYIFSNTVNAHPLEIFLVIILAGSFAGVVGMIFAVPIYSFIRIIARQFLQNFRVVRTMTKNM